MPERRIVDLSVPLTGVRGDPTAPKVRHQSHWRNAFLMMAAFRCRRRDLPRGLGWANDSLTLATHSGTHVDAPWHYFPTSEGQRARTIDELPLDWFLGDGVRLDLRHLPDGSVIAVADLETALRGIDYALRPGDIVLLWTGAGERWGTRDYFGAGSGLDRDSTLWLCDQGIKVIGTDAWGLDPPFWAIRRRFRETRDPGVLWSSHRAGIEREYCQIEKLANLGRLPSPTGFTVSCLPVKVAGGSAGWCRAVAILDE